MFHKHRMTSDASMDNQKKRHASTGNKLGSHKNLIIYPYFSSYRMVIEDCQDRPGHTNWEKKSCFFFFLRFQQIRSLTLGVHRKSNVMVKTNLGSGFVLWKDVEPPRATFQESGDFLVTILVFKYWFKNYNSPNHQKV